MATVIARTYEWDGQKWNLVVKHEFYGADLPAARAVYAAHIQADAFLRECTETGRYAGRVTCRTMIEEQL